MASVTPRVWTKADGSPGRVWMVRYLDPATGKRPGKSFDLKKDAEAFKRKVEREIEDGTHVTKGQALTVSEVCAKYVEASEARRRRGEVGRTRLVQINIMVDKHIAPVIGAKRFCDLTVADVDRLYDVLSEKVSTFYARLIVSNLGTIERWAARQGYLRTSPVSTALKGIKRQKVERIEEFTSEQVMTILSHVIRRKAVRPRYGALIGCFVHLAACCGLRIGEILALDLDSINLERRVIRVRRNLTQLGELKGPKSEAGNRDVPMPDHLHAMLRIWIEKYYRENDGNYIFTTYASKRMEASNIRHGWRVVLKECDLYKRGAVFHFHALRHFAGSWWLENGMAIQDVAMQMGHADASTTLKIYAHTLSKIDDRQAAMTRMGALLLPKMTTTATHGLLTA